MVMEVGMTGRVNRCDGMVTAAREIRVTTLCQIPAKALVIELLRNAGTMPA